MRIGRSDNLEQRKRTFIDRYYDIEEHNASENSTYTLAINEFSHLTDEEFLQLKTGLVQQPGDRSGEVLEPITDRLGRAKAPASFDWRNVNNVVRPVQNQGQCGSCWAFAAIGALEGQMTLRKGRTDKLSEQEIIECVTYGGSLLGCNGGWDGAVYDHARVRRGVTTQASNRYLAYTNGRRCNVGTPRASGSAVSTQSYLPRNNEPNMKEVLFNTGPLYVILHASNELQSYRSGIYQDSRKYCNGRSPNHAVLLIGYGNQNGVDYWIIKNSWGTGWGENGILR